MNWSDIRPDKGSSEPKQPSQSGFLYIKLCNPVCIPNQETGEIVCDCDCSWHDPCRTPGKVPLSKDWNQKGSSVRPEGNAGIIVGKQAGYIVFDVDSEDAAAVYKNWNLPETRTHKTGKGHHYFFQFPGGVDRLPGRFCKILVRGSKAPEQVVAPESVHQNGFVYSVDLDLPIAKLPTDFVAEMVSEEQSQQNFGSLEKLTEGERHLGFFSMASTFSYRAIPIDTAIVAALHFNKHHCEPPAPEENVIKIVQDAYNRYPAKQPFMNEYRQPQAPSTGRGWRV